MTLAIMETHYHLILFPCGDSYLSVLGVLPGENITLNGDVSRTHIPLPTPEQFGLKFPK